MIHEETSPVAKAFFFCKASWDIQEGRGESDQTVATITAAVHTTPILSHMAHSPSTATRRDCLHTPPG